MTRQASFRRTAALAELDRTVGILDAIESSDVAPLGQVADAAELLAAIDDIANGLGVPRGEARWAKGDEATAAAILTELRDDHTVALAQVAPGARLADIR